MANLKTEIILSMNGKAAIQVLEALRDKAKSVREEIDNLDKNAPDFKNQKVGLEKVYDALQSAHENIIKDTERLDTAIQNLSSTSLQNLRKALGDGRRELQKLSEDELAKADEIRKKMKMAGDQIRLLEGQYVKIADGLENVKNQSDQWLDKALKQQRELVGSLQKSDASYQQNLDTLRRLEEEEDRRKGKMSKFEAFQTVKNEDASASDLRRAKTTFIEARDNTPTKYSATIDDYNRALQNIEKRLEAVSGKAQKATMSWKEMRQVLSAPNKASGEDIKRTMEVIQQKIQQLPAGSKYVATLRRQYTMLEQTLKGTRMSQMALNDILNRSKQGKASLDELRRAYKQLEEELNQVNTKSKEFADKQKSMKELKKNIDNATGAVNKQGGAWQTAMKNLTAYVGLFAMFNKAKELVTGAIKKNLEYSGSLTDIRKVSGLTMEQVKQLSTELSKIDTRTSVDGLAQLAYQGAKLGMGKYGVDGMAQFVKAADKINVALGEELGEEALPALSKMVEVMGLIPKMGIEKAMDATGSAMFKLSTTSTATSNDIVEFAKRLTGVARTAGITTDQLLALGSASSSMMLMPEVASTAFGKFITALQKNHNLIAKELGIPDETIKNLYASGHAMDAMVLVFEKMRDKGNMNALGGIFKDLGSDGQKLVTAMVTMAKNVDMLKDHLYESEEAFREATAVTNEYEMQQQSAIGILERANNLWEKAFVNPDGVDAVKGMAEWWYEMSQTMTSSPLLKGTLLIALQMVLMALKAVATLLPVIIGYMAAQGVYSGLMLIRQYGAALGLAIKELYAYATASRTATAAQVGLNAAQKMNPWVALASVIIALAGVIYGYAQQAREAAKAAAEAERQANAWKDTLGQAAVETSNLNRKLANYKKMMNEANLTQKERQSLISRFNKDFRSYISNLGIEIKSVKDLRDHYSELAQEAQRATYYRMMVKAKEQALPKLDAERDAAANELIRQLKKSNLDLFGVKFQDIDRWVSKGADGNAVYRYLVSKLPVQQTGMFSGLRYKVDNKGRLYTTNKAGGRVYAHYQNLDLLSASRWYANATGRRRKKEKEIEDNYSKWFPEDYTPYPEETPGTLENNAPVKDAIAQEKRDKLDRERAKREQERAWREELKQKQDEANAIMNNLSNFYDRQINAKMEQAISLGMDKTEQDLFVEPMRRRKNDALEQLRLAIAGKANTWEQFKSTMKGDLVEQTDGTGVNLSEDLLESITSNNIDALRKKLEGLANSLNRPLNSILAEVFAKATKNAQANLKLETQQQEARRKAIQEHDYTGVVQQSAYDTFNLLGYANPTDAEIKDKAAFDKRKANIIAMFEKAREEITKVFAADVSTEEGRGLLMKTLFGDDPDGMSKRIAEVLGNDAKEWQAFYQKLIQYNDEYIAAEKKQYDDAKKNTDFLWKRNERNLAQQERIRQIQEESNLFGKRTNLLSNLGLADLTADPEVELMKARMQAAEDYYAFVERNTKNQQLIDEAERARQEAELAYANQMATAMKSRLSQMKELVQPIEDFGAAVGQALAEMRYDAESANDAIKSALKSMLESWTKMALNDVNTQMWKAINDAAAKRGRANAQPDIDAARANAKPILPSNEEDPFTNFRNIGTADNPVWVRMVNGVPEGVDGQPKAVPLSPTGKMVQNPDGTYGFSGEVSQVDYENVNEKDFLRHVLGSERSGSILFTDISEEQEIGEANEQPGVPRAWKKRHPDGTLDEYNQEAADIAGQVGGNVADLATGNISLSDVVSGVGGSVIGELVNTDFSANSNNNEKKEKKERKKRLKEEKKHQRELTRENRKGSKEREKINEKGVKNITKISENAGKEQTKLEEVKQNTTNAIVESGLNTTFQKKQENDAAVVEQSKDTAQAENTFSIVGAIGKCFEFLGPIAGPIAAASVMAILTGLMQWGLNAAFGSKKKNSSSSTKNTKLVSGMLTYDSGNVQDLKPFVADNGEIYWAKEQDKPQSGVNLLTTPTATAINGQRALVAENGPELVIGRETTKAMMMNNPSLLKALVNYDRNYSGRNAVRRAFDEGNVSESVGNLSSGASATYGLIADSSAANIALITAINTLMQRLEQPIEAKIDMYGRGKLYDSITKANQFMKNK